MRRIDLLPEAGGKRKAAGPVRLRGYGAFAGPAALVAAVLIAVLAYAWQASSISQMRAHQAEAQKELENLKPVLAAVEALRQVKNTLTTKMEIVDKLMVGRFLWARKLSELSALLSSKPSLRDNIFLTHMGRDTERKTVVEMVPSKVKGSEPMAPKRSTVSVPVLRLEGAVFTPGSEEAIELVGDFQRAIEQDTVFFRHFAAVDFREAQTMEVMGKPVWGFELYCEFKPGIL